MTRFSKSMIVMVVTACGLWGCARGPAGSAAQAERLHALEAKCAKYEEDYRAVAAARDQAKKAVAGLQQEQARIQKELTLKQEAEKERDDLRKQIETRIGERDQLQARCDRLKKGIQSLLGDEGVVAPGAGGPSLSITQPAPASTSVTEGQAAGGGKL
jgi:predicted RNase H-like nuclease (RuvC/YqgF family)